MKTDTSKIRGGLRRFIVTHLNDGATRASLEEAYRARSDSTSPGVYQALRYLESAGLVTHEIGEPSGGQGRTPFVYRLTDAGKAARASIPTD